MSAGEITNISLATCSLVCLALQLIALSTTTMVQASSNNLDSQQPKFELKFQSELDNSTVIKRELQQQIFKCQARLAPVASINSGQRASRLKWTSSPVVPPLLLPDQTDHQGMGNGSANGTNAISTVPNNQARWPINVVLIIDWFRNGEQLSGGTAFGAKEPIVVLNVELKSNSSGLRNDKNKSKARIEIKNTLNGNQLKLTSRLKLSQLKVPDSGQYKCVARASYIQVIANDLDKNSSQQQYQQQLLVEQTLESNGVNLMVTNNHTLDGVARDGEGGTSSSNDADEESHQSNAQKGGGKFGLDKKHAQASGGAKSNLDLASGSQEQQQQKTNDMRYAMSGLHSKGRQAPPAASSTDSRAGLVAMAPASDDQNTPEESSGSQSGGGVGASPMSSRDSNEFEVGAAIASGKLASVQSGQAQQPLFEDDEDLARLEPEFISGQHQQLQQPTTNDEELSADSGDSATANANDQETPTDLVGSEDEWAANWVAKLDNNNESSPPPPSSSSFSFGSRSNQQQQQQQQQQLQRQHRPVPPNQNLVISSKRARPNNNNNRQPQLEPDSNETRGKYAVAGGDGRVIGGYPEEGAGSVMDGYFSSSLDSTKLKLAKFVHKIAPELSCYTGLGKHYRGNVSISADKRVCLNWLHFRRSRTAGALNSSPILRLDPRDDNHNYCRNPNLDPAGPWCFVLYDEQLDGAILGSSFGSASPLREPVGGELAMQTAASEYGGGGGGGGRPKYIQRPCSISLCSEYLWLFIVAPPLGLLMLLSCLIVVVIRSIRKSHYNSVLFADGKRRPALPKQFNKLLMSRGRFAPKKFGATGGKKSCGNYLDDDVFEIVDDLDWSDGQTQSLSPKSTESLRLDSSFSSSSNEGVVGSAGYQRNGGSGCKLINPTFFEKSLLDGSNHHKETSSSSAVRTNDLLGGGGSTGNRSKMQVGPMFATLRCHIRGSNHQVHQAKNVPDMMQETTTNKSSNFIEQCDLANNSNNTRFAASSCTTDWMAPSQAAAVAEDSQSNKQHISMNGHLISCSTTMDDIEPIVVDGTAEASSKETCVGEKYVTGNELPQLNASSVVLAVNQQPLYEGKFSQVQLAYAKQDSSKNSKISSSGCIGAQVAVCSLKANASIDSSLFNSSKLKLHNLNHLNLIKLIGYSPNEDEIGRDKSSGNNSVQRTTDTSTTGGGDLGANRLSTTCSLIFDMAQLVDLSDWLKQQSRDTLTGDEPLGNDLGTRKNLTCFAKQIALAVDYLHDQGIIYKDIACRNCFLDPTKMLVKLASFNSEFVINSQDEKAQSLKSMIRPKYLLDYYVIDSRPSDCQLLPLSWIPLESILFNKFNKQTDVWSFGCLLYELFSLGEVAYFGYSSKQVIDAVRSNLMPPKPLLCPNGIYKLMCRCLSDIPSIRPDVKQIYEHLNLHSGQCSSFLDHHLCSLAMTPPDDQQQGQASHRFASTMNRQNSITKTKSYANIRNFVPLSSCNSRGQDQTVRYDNLVRLPSDITHLKPEVAKIPNSKSINLGASRLAPFQSHHVDQRQSQNQKEFNDDINHYDEPNVQVHKNGSKIVDFN